MPPTTLQARCSDIKAGSIRSATCSDALEMRAIEPFGAAERKADAMQRYRIIAADGVEIAQRRAAAHVIFGVNLHPGDVGPRVEHRLMVLKAQPDPGFRRNRAASRVTAGGHGGRICRSGRRRSCRPGSCRSRRRAAGRRTWCRAPGSPGRRRNARPRRSRSSRRH